MKTKTKQLPLVTPGEMLVEEFLKPLGLTEYRLAKDLGVPPRCMERDGELPKIGRCTLLVAA